MIERRRRGEAPREDKGGMLFVIRQIINLIFIIGAIVGMALYYFNDDNTTAIIVIMSVMVLKMFECVLRYLK